MSALRTGVQACARPTDGTLTDDELLAQAAAAERRSEHPIARAIVTAADQRSLTVREPDSFTAAVGGGVHASVNGTDLTIGSPSYLTGQGHDLSGISELVERLEAAGNTTVVLAGPDGPLGVLGVRSEEHTSALQSLMRISYAVFCLT